MGEFVYVLGISVLFPRMRWRSSAVCGSAHIRKTRGCVCVQKARLRFLQFPQDMASLIAETVDLPPLATDARFSQPSSRTISRSCSHLLRPHLSYERPGDVLFLSTNLQKGSETCGRVRELLHGVLYRTDLLGETQKNLS